MEELIEFYSYIEQLKCVTRYKSFKAMHENVAGHIFGTLFVAYDLMAKYDLKLNKSHVLELLLFHDLAEAGMKFDIEAPNSAGNANIKQLKHIEEVNKISAISEKFKKPYIIKFFNEFEEKQTREALFANLVDKIEAQNHMIQNKCKDLQVLEYYNFIINFADKYVLHFPELNGVVEQLKQKLKSFIPENLK